MSRRLSTSRATIATGIHNDSLATTTTTAAATSPYTIQQQTYSNDEKPKYSFPTTRRHFYNRKTLSPSPEEQQQQSILFKNPKRSTLTVFIIVILLFLIALTRSPSNKIVNVPLRDQPPYDTLLSKRQCTATLCNIENKCATWRPHHEQHHDAKQLEQEGMYRNVAKIQVDLGCELLLKVSDGTWMTITQGETNCIEQGCQDVVEVDLQADLYILASQLKQLVAGKDYSVKRAC